MYVHNKLISTHKRFGYWLHLHINFSTETAKGLPFPTSHYKKCCNSRLLDFRNRFLQENVTKYINTFPLGKTQSE